MVDGVGMILLGIMGIVTLAVLVAAYQISKPRECHELRAFANEHPEFEYMGVKFRALRVHNMMGVDRMLAHYLDDHGILRVAEFWPRDLEALENQ